MDSFFRPSIDAVVKGMHDQNAGNVDVRYPTVSNSDYSLTVNQFVIITGGFGASPYLKKVLRDEFQASGVRIISPDDGAL